MIIQLVGITFLIVILLIYFCQHNKENFTGYVSKYDDPKLNEFCENEYDNSCSKLDLCVHEDEKQKQQPMTDGNHDASEKFSNSLIFNDLEKFCSTQYSENLCDFPYCEPHDSKKRTH